MHQAAIDSSRCFPTERMGSLFCASAEEKQRSQRSIINEQCRKERKKTKHISIFEFSLWITSDIFPCEEDGTVSHSISTAFLEDAPNYLYLISHFLFVINFCFPAH